VRTVCASYASPDPRDRALERHPCCPMGLGEHDVSCFDRSISLRHVINFLSMTHDHEAVAHLIGVIEIVRYEHAGHVLGAQLFDVV
jgi:hypothetical protein